MNKIMACAIAKYEDHSDVPYCEAPRHQGQQRPTWAIILIMEDDQESIFQPTCKLCYSVIEADMGQPIWGKDLEPDELRSGS